MAEPVSMVLQVPCWDPKLHTGQEVAAAYIVAKMATIVVPGGKQGHTYPRPAVVVDLGHDLSSEGERLRKPYRRWPKGMLK